MALTIRKQGQAVGYRAEEFIAGANLTLTRDVDGKVVLNAEVTGGSHDHDDRYYTESEVDSFLLTKANVSHTHAWADITGEPVYTTRWPSWTEVTSKPTTFAPSAHTHPWADVTGTPVYTTRWPSWTEVTSKPSTFAPSTHTHPWSEITSQPVYATRWPTWGEVSGKPTWTGQISNVGSGAMSFGSIALTASLGGYAGVHFASNGHNFMIRDTDALSGLYDDVNNHWVWQFTATGELGVGTVPWDHLTAVPAFAARWPTWTEVTGKPTTFAPSAHSHAWADITGEPAFTTRWPTYAEVTSKPATFPPDTHTHLFIERSGSNAYVTNDPTALFDKLAVYFSSAQTGTPGQYGNIFYVGSHGASNHGAALQLWIPYRQNLNGQAGNDGVLSYRTGRYQTSGWTEWQAVASREWATATFPTITVSTSGPGAGSGKIHIEV